MHSTAVTALSLMLLLATAVPAAAVQVTCLGRAATIVGTSKDDVLVGTSGSDVIHGGSGDDVIRGLGGDDRLCGGPEGLDRLHGGAGRDRLSVRGHGTDSPHEEHYAKAFGGEGSDSIIARGFYAVGYGGGSADHLHSIGARRLRGGGGDDTMTAAKEPWTHFSGGPGADVIADQTNMGVLSFAFLDGPVVVDLWAGTVRGYGADRVSGIHLVQGSDGDDVIRGDAAAEQLLGGPGDDTVVGRGGDDTLDGEAGNDDLDGGGGVDTCRTGETTRACELML